MQPFNCAEAIEACAAGDRAALRALFDAEGPKLCGIAMRILKQHDLAEDAVQEAFVKVWNRAHQFDRSRGSAQGWLYAIVRNCALTTLRNTSREVATEQESIEAVIDETVLDTTWERLDHSSALYKCLAELEEAKRNAVLMSYVLGYSHGEIAGRIGKPLGTTKAWVRRGLASLRECMA